jgi:hypothetical protein
VSSPERVVQGVIAGLEYERIGPAVQQSGLLLASPPGFAVLRCCLGRDGRDQVDGRIPKTLALPIACARPLTPNLRANSPTCVARGPALEILLSPGCDYAH